MTQHNINQINQQSGLNYICNIHQPKHLHQIVIPDNHISSIEIQILLIMNQSTKTSIKLEHITKRVSRLLQDKYDFDESKSDQKFGQGNMSQIIHRQELLEAYQKSERMSLKLKQIRTLLGFEKESQAKQIDSKKNASQNKRQTVNLKNFVQSMRKKNQTIKSSTNQGITITKQSTSIGNDDPGLQQYTDASLKYIKSFLPHQTLIDYKHYRQRKVSSENMNKKTVKNEVDSMKLQQLKLKLLQTAKKHEYSPERNVTNIDFSPIASKWQTITHSYEKKSVAGDNAKDQAINQYYTINIDSPRNTYMKQKSKTKRLSSPLDFLAGKTIQTTYKSKTKQRHNKFRQQSRQVKPQTRETIKRIVPVILPCIPKQRQFI